jgi:hypothetical protein
MSSVTLGPNLWVEPYADERHGLDEGLAAFEAHYGQRESIELAPCDGACFLPGQTGSWP